MRRERETRRARETIKEGNCRGRRGGNSKEGREKHTGKRRVAISTLNNIGGNLAFLLELHLHVYKQE